MEASTLYDVFDKYAEERMNGRTFVKVFKDAKLINKKLSTTSLDIIFSKVKTKGQMKITPEEFIRGVELAAMEKQVDFESLVEKLSQSKGPQYKGTKAQHVKLHDDKSQYTGVYARGGPTTVDKRKNKIVDLSDFANRGDADIRGVSKKYKSKEDQLDDEEYYYEEHMDN